MSAACQPRSERFLHRKHNVKCEIPSIQGEDALISKLRIDPSILSVCEPTKISLKDYEYQSPKLRELNIERMEGKFKPKSGDEEKDVYFRMNATGNIYYSQTVTTEELNEATKKMFQSVSVLFAAMTSAMHKEGKDLFEYGAWTQMIGASGFFVEMQKYRKTIAIKSNSLTIDTQIVSSLIPGLSEGPSLNICKDVLSSLSGEFNSGSHDESTKLAHLLFICEELFGVPTCFVRVFFGSTESHSKTTSSPCHRASSISFDQLQEANTFMFVDPDYIAEFAHKFGEHPQEYQDLIDRLAGIIKDGDSKSSSRK